MNALHEVGTLRPATVEEAVRTLAEGGAQALAGGTDLLPNLRRGLGTPRVLVDLTAVPALDAIAVQADGSLRIGAAATLAALAADAAVRTGWPVLAKAAGLVAGPTHREAATIGGNLCQDTRCVFYNQSEWWRAGNGYCLKYLGDKCHVVVKSDRCYATYHGDLAPALMALDASVEIAGPAGARTLPVAGLFVEDGARRLTLAPGEWVSGVVAPPASGWIADYAKARVRESVDFALAGAAVALRRDGERIGALRVAITGTNSAPLAVPTDSVVGRSWDAETAQVLTKLVHTTSHVLATTVASVGYRRRMAQALVRRLVDDLWARV